MQHFSQAANGLPIWSAGAEQRLGASMLLATIVLMFAISWLRLPSSSESPPLTRLVIDLVLAIKEAPVTTPIEAPVELPIETPATKSAAVEVPLPPQNTSDEVSDLGKEEALVIQPKTDWQEKSLAAVRDVLDENAKTYSINPNFDEKRRQAAKTYRPSEAPVKKEIWDNIEKDYLGRTIWRNGGCYKIPDNPSAVYRWVFDTFERYMTYCDGSGEEYLIEFDAIPDRYDYLEKEFANGIP